MRLRFESGHYTLWRALAACAETHRGASVVVASAAIAGMMLPGACAAAEVASDVRAMLAAAAMPDGADAVRVVGGIGLGERRLFRARASPSPSPAPARALAEAGGLAVAAWVRLDDRRALCSVLGVPQRASDSELILHAYRRWGVECPRHLLGDYGFAIVDGHRQRLFLARDHAGVRPLYYALVGGGFVFASALESVLAGPGVDRQLDDASVATYLKFVGWGTWTESRTFFRAVRMLPAGHALVVERGRRALRLRSWRHWAPEDAPTLAPATADDYAAGFLDLYAAAVRDRLTGSGLVGVHLSGGLDSSAAAVLASRELRRQGRPPPAAFSWLPRSTRQTRFATAAAGLEYGLVEATAAHEGLAVDHAVLAPGAIFDALAGGDAVQPWAHTNLLDAAVQRQAAAQGVGVLLSGYGGDQAISSRGQAHYVYLLSTGRWREFAALAEARDRRGLARAAANAVLTAPPDGAALRSLLWPLRRRLRRETGAKPAKHFLHPALASLARPERPDEARDVRQQQLVALAGFRLRPRLEAEVASGLRCGLEYRYPLLDRRILEFALGLPPHMYLRPSASRFLMRRALGLALGAERPLLPPVVRWNESKFDRFVGQAYTDAFVASLPAFRERLAGQPPSRSSYVDMPRLLAWLDAPRFRRYPRLEGLSRALLFLDL